MAITWASNMATNPSNGIMWLEKAETGKVTIDDIKDALEEFARLFKAGFASKAETLTLARAFPENRKYTEAAGKLGDDDPMVCLLYTSPSPRDRQKSRMPSSA